MVAREGSKRVVCGRGVESTTGPDPVPPRGGAGEQPDFEHRVVQVGRQRPAEPAFRRPPQIAVDGPHADAAGPGHRLVGQSLPVSEPQYLANLPHQQPPCRHRLTLPSER